jgi:uncharacterized protein involved in exopolysaccharide biosynthesis
VRSSSRRFGQRDEFTFSEILYILRQRVLLILGVTALLVLVALGISFLQTPTYTAQSVLVVQSERGLGDGGSSNLAQEVLNSVVDRELVEEAARQSGWPVGEFNERLEVEAAGLDEILVRFSAPEPEQAAAGANAYAGALVERVSELSQGALVGGTLAADARVVQEAGAPERPAGTHPLVNAGVAGGLGVLLGSAVALVLENRTRHWWGVRDVELTLRAPVLGVIPDYGSGEREP